MQAKINVDLRELNKFAERAHRWWDTESEFKPLHQINPLRLKWINSFIDLKDKKVLDVGCGGGILSEGLAKMGSHVKGIDLAEKSLKVADLHSLESGIQVDYEAIDVETLSLRESKYYDVVTCMEMLEHVPNPQSIIQACARLVKPGGWVFFSTLNRHPKAYLLAVLGAEYILNLLPRGTHNYEKFIKPSELSFTARHCGLTVSAMTGLHYNPLTQEYKIAKGTDVNYLMACQASL